MKNICEITENTFGNRPEKVLQFGEGNFLRGFADWMIDLANKDGLFGGSIVLCQPIAAGMADMINGQNGLYTLLMRGTENGVAREDAAMITSVSRCINPYADYEALLAIARSPELKVVISNTTEAGIAYHAGDNLTDRPPASYPAKLTAFLHERFTALGDGEDSALLVLPVELIDDNGPALARIVRQYAEEWGLSGAFMRWLEERVHIANTLVDRIVTGYPREEIAAIEEKLGYTDKLIVTSELFNLWVIEGKKEWADILPIHKTKAGVIWTDDVKPYKMRKVRILNGGHTATVLAAFLAGHDTVLDFMRDDLFRTYLGNLLFGEVIPTLDLPENELKDFATSVMDRFDNPYIRHRLLDISLNSCAKFAARCLPSLLEYRKRKQALPELLVFSLAAFITFYKGAMTDGRYMGMREDGTAYEIRDDAQVLEFFAEIWKKNPASEDISRAVLARENFWNGQDLTAVPGLAAAVGASLERIRNNGARVAVSALLHATEAR